MFESSWTEMSVHETISWAEMSVHEKRERAPDGLAFILYEILVEQFQNLRTGHRKTKGPPIHRNQKPTHRQTHLQFYSELTAN